MRRTSPAGIGVALVALAWPGLVAAQSVEGTVRTLAGLPLDSATVQVGDRSIMTDRSGSFRISGLEAGRYTLTTRRIGYRTSRIAIELRDSTLSVEIRLSAAEPVQLQTVIVEATRTGLYGVVADRDLRPLPGAEVRVLGKRGRARRTDGLGRFAFPDIEGGDFFVVVRLAGHAERRFSVSIAEGQGREVMVRLLRAEGRALGGGNAERWDQFELERRLAWAFNRDVWTREELKRFGSIRLCDIPMVRALVGPDPEVILDGWRRFPDACAWNADEVELLELPRGPSRRRGGPYSGVLRVWLGN